MLTGSTTSCEMFLRGHEESAYVNLPGLYGNHNGIFKCFESKLILLQFEMIDPSGKGNGYARTSKVHNSKSTFSAPILCTYRITPGSKCHNIFQSFQIRFHSRLEIRRRRMIDVLAKSARNAHTYNSSRAVGTILHFNLVTFSPILMGDMLVEA